MTYEEQFQMLHQRTADACAAWLNAQKALVNDDQRFTNKALWDNLDYCASNLQKAQNEFNKLRNNIQSEQAQSG